MKGTLTFMHGTSRTLEELQKVYPENEGCDINEIEPELFNITVPLEEIDPDNPYKAMEDYQAETGEDCWEVFTVRLDDGQEFTEENYEG